ncbi:MAG: HelD family protein [Acidimicrobiales bacterium]
MTLPRGVSPGVARAGEEGWVAVSVDELDAEQAHIDRSYACLERMRARTTRLLADAPEDPDLLNTLRRRVEALTDGGRPLCFGRIDTTDETFHIGRRHVEDEMADPVVVEWRAPIAVPFYRATNDEPMGLQRRRQFVVESRSLMSMADDLFGEMAVTDTGPRVRARDALLAELERARTGQMLDIVATIQAEQDVVIRAPQPGVLCVQGGPGTGKTAIGLHRAAFLLFGNDDLSRDGVLVIGPNRTFLRYIAQVLPSLGEAAVVQSTLSDLVPEAPVRAKDASVEVARLKGDARMADVLRRGLVARRGTLDDDVEIRFATSRARLDAGEANEIAVRIASRRVPYAAGRTTLRDRLLQLLFDQHAEGVGRNAAGDYRDSTRAIAATSEFRAALDRLWPAVSPAAYVRELLTRPARLAAAADGILDAAEQATLRRKGGKGLRNEPWTETEGPLVDAAVELVEGNRRTYGHIVIDEAQDVSPMQALMLARRCPIGSMTILGDLAQGTGVWARDDWSELVAHLPTPNGVVYETLGLGYRAPGRVLEVANRMLPEIAPGLRPTESIRPGRHEPRFVGVADDDGVVPAAAEATASLVRDGFQSIGVIVPMGWERPIEDALAAGHLDAGDAERHGLDHQVTVLPGPAAKGLEFDAVVVVEPDAIAADAPRGLRLVYIAITRPTQALVVVHHRPLPAALAVTR